MKLKIHGVRGSLPAPLRPEEIERRIAQAIEGFVAAGHTKVEEFPAYLGSLTRAAVGGYGGNTPCVEVKSEKTQIIIDGGTGIRDLGIEMMKGPCGKGQGEVHILMTHFHWDHLIGFPFFVPIFRKGNVVNIYAVQPDLEETIRLLFRKPYFPVPFEALGAKVVFHRLEPRQARVIGDIVATPYQLDHPDPCWGYRLESEGHVIAHCVDSETTRFTREALGPDLPLYQNVDLMVFDAQYSLVESITKENWGHGTAMVGLDLALREAIKHVLFMHHDPSGSDPRLHDMEQATRRYYEIQQRRPDPRVVPFPEVSWSFATEGQEIDLAQVVSDSKRRAA